MSCVIKQSVLAHVPDMMQCCLLGHNLKTAATVVTVPYTLCTIFKPLWLTALAKLNLDVNAAKCFVVDCRILAMFLIPLLVSE